MRELRARLDAAGHPTEDRPGEFGPSTEVALCEFQRSRGLEAHGVCDPATWDALTEAGFRLGDRLLYRTQPMLRGDDVAELQLRLGALGFDAGRVDGILGPMTQKAVGEFQRNAGLVCDEVCGPDTVAALVRLQGRAGTSTVAGVRERVFLRRRSTVNGATVALGHAGDAGLLIGELAAGLEAASLGVVLVEHEDWSAQARRVNELGCDLYLGITVVGGPTLEADFFATEGFESSGGRRLAELVVGELPAVPGWAVGRVRGMRLPVLRETRPPAVLLRLGPGEDLDSQRSLVSAALHRAVITWCTSPY